MPQLSLGVKVVICAGLSIILCKLVIDQQQIRWHPKKLPRPEDDLCPDLVDRPQPHSEWPNWTEFADDLAEEVREADEGEGYDVIFYGDSITEQWRGTAVGAPYPKLKAIREVFEAHFTRNYSSNVLAIAGDQVGHLWWRLLNGEVAERRHPKAVVLLIGTNDLTADDCHESEAASLKAVDGILARINLVLDLLRNKLPGTQIALLGLLPRDALITGPPTLEWPNRMTAAISAANAHFEAIAAADERTHFLDCGAPYLLAGGGLDGRLLPDALHPNAAGMELLATCLQPLLDALVAAPGPAAGGPELRPVQGL